MPSGIDPGGHDQTRRVLLLMGLNEPCDSGYSVITIVTERLGRNRHLRNIRAGDSPGNREVGNTAATQGTVHDRIRPIGGQGLIRTHVPAEVQRKDENQMGECIFHAPDKGRKKGTHASPGPEIQGRKKENNSYGTFVMFQIVGDVIWNTVFWNVPR